MRLWNLIKAKKKYKQQQQQQQRVQRDTFYKAAKNEKVSQDQSTTGEDP